MRIAILFFPAALAFACRPALAQQALPTNAAARYFTDVELIDQDGQGRRFYTDLLKGKVVVINAFFTTCHDSCPVMADRFAKIQSWLGDRLGKKVHLISMSVDPENDTQTRLKEFAAKFNARPGWYLLSGKKENVDFVLHKLGQSVSDKNDHLNVFLIGNE